MPASTLKQYSAKAQWQRSLPIEHIRICVALVFTHKDYYKSSIYGSYQLQGPFEIPVYTKSKKQNTLTNSCITFSSVESCMDAWKIMGKCFKLFDKTTQTFSKRALKYLNYYRFNELIFTSLMPLHSKG